MARKFGNPDVMKAAKIVKGYDSEVRISVCDAFLEYFSIVTQNDIKVFAKACKVEVCGLCGALCTHEQTLDDGRPVCYPVCDDDDLGSDENFGVSD